MMSIRNISRVALVLLLPLLLGWSTDASAGMRKKLNFVKNPDGGTVKVEFNSNGTWTEKNPGDDVMNGVQLKITATPNSGKEFESMQVNGKDVTNKVKKEGTASVYNCYAAGEGKTDDMNIVVVFKTLGQTAKHKLTFTSPEGATVKVKAGDVEVESGVTEIEAEEDLVISIEVTEKTKRVKSVKLNGNTVEKVGDNWEAKMPAIESTLVVTLEEKPKSKITIQKPEGVELKIEDVSENPAKPIAEDADVMEGTQLSITVTKVPADKELSQVLFGDDVLELVDGKYTATMPGYTVTLKVILKEPTPFTFTFAGTAEFAVVAKSGGASLVSPAQVTAGQKVTLTLTVNAGIEKVIKSVKVGDIVANKAANADEWEFVMPEKDATLAVELVEKSKTHKVIFAGTTDYTIVVTNITAGNQTINSEDAVAEGSELLAVITVTDPKKEVKVVKANTTDATKGADANHWTFSMGTEDITLTVELQNKPEPAKYKLTIAAVEGAKVTVKVDGNKVESEQEVEEGKKLVVSVEVTATDKEVESVKLNTTPATKNGETYEVEMPKAAATLTVTLKEKAAPQPGEGNVLTIVANGTTVKVMNGTTEVKSGEKVAKDVKLTVEVSDVPAEKEIDKVTLNEVEMTLVEGKYEGNMPDAAATLTVILKEKGAPVPSEGNLIKVTANGATVKIMAGTTEVKEDTKVKAGTDLVITVTAPAGKMIDNVSFNGTVVKPEANKSYKVKMSATEATLVVKLKKATAVEDAVLAGVVAYPNPMVRELVVSNLAEVENVALVNAQGVVVRTVKPNGASELRLAVEDFPAGVYMLVVERNGARKAIRIVK